MNNKQIRRIQEKLKLTRAQLGELIGADLATLSEWEFGKSAPKGLHLKALKELQKRQTPLDRIVIPELDTIPAFAMVVDINNFVGMVSADDPTGLIAQFTRDILAGPIDAIERSGGEVVSYMGDAILGVFSEGGRTDTACFDIAKDLDQVCEYISNQQSRCPDDWSFAKGGPTIKIGIEFGLLNISTITSRFLGTHRLLVGDAINYASRITAAGKGNRCHIGRVAAAMPPFSDYRMKGPLFVKGKRGENQYEYYEFALGDVWIEGPRRKGKDTYWG